MRIRRWLKTEAFLTLLGLTLALLSQGVNAGICGSRMTDEPPPLNPGVKFGPSRSTEASGDSWALVQQTPTEIVKALFTGNLVLRAFEMDPVDWATAISVEKDPTYFLGFPNSIDVLREVIKDHASQLASNFPTNALNESSSGLISLLYYMARKQYKLETITVETMQAVVSDVAERSLTMKKGQKALLRRVVLDAARTHRHFAKLSEDDITLTDNGDLHADTEEQGQAWEANMDLLMGEQQLGLGTCFGQALLYSRHRVVGPVLGPIFGLRTCPRARFLQAHYLLSRHDAATNLPDRSLRALARYPEKGFASIGFLPFLFDKILSAPHAEFNAKNYILVLANKGNGNGHAVYVGTNPFQMGDPFGKRFFMQPGHLVVALAIHALSIDDYDSFAVLEVGAAAVLEVGAAECE